MSAAAPVSAPRGRPRSERADRAIITAALDVLVEEGAARFSVETVAQRAGVGKSTIYRRFTCSGELLAEALATLNDDLVQPEPGMATREALIAIVDGIRQRSADGTPDRCLPQVLSQAHRSPELFDIYFERVVAPRRARVRSVLEQGVAAGEIRHDLDLDVLVSLFTAPMLSMVVMTPPSRQRVDAGTAAAIVDAVLEGVRPAP